MKSKRPARILGIILALGLPVAATAQTAPASPGSGFLGNPNALGSALDAMGRAEGLEKPLPCPSDPATKCRQGPTADQLKILGLFGAFTQSFAPPNDSGNGDYPYSYGFGRRQGWMDGNDPGF